MTAIKKCKCDHKGQDKIYGKKMRVFNFREGKKTWRCTVCQNEVSGGDPYGS